MVLEVLLFSVNNEDSKQVQSLRRGMERDQSVAVFDLDDVHHEHQNIKTYAGKLEKMTSERLCRIFLINSDNLVKIIDNRDFNVDIEEFENDRVQKIISQLIDSEKNKDKNESRLVLLSFDAGESVPEGLKHIEHVRNISSGIGANGDTVISEELLSDTINPLCRFEFIPSNASQQTKKEKGGKQEKGCIIA